jgi:ATP-dependent Lhr-like helicase
LARIHRLTISQLRSEIEPVTSAQFMQWLLKWQHLAPGTQLKGITGLLEVIKQLQGFELPAKAWERQILAKRVSDYEGGMLDRLCLTGAIGWGRLSLHPLMLEENDSRRITANSIIPITFFVRDELNWWQRPKLLTKENDTVLSHVAKNIYKFLDEKGASFIADIQRGIARLPSEVETGLWELIAAGLVTADSFDNLRSLIDSNRRLKKRKPRNIFSQRNLARWSLLRTEENHYDNLKYLEDICRVLLNRYGVVFRDLLARETIIPSWRQLLETFRRLEARGEIRGGRFVSGFVGEQFALPYAVESLRAARKQMYVPQELNISAVDPLNLVGIILSGKRVPAISGKIAVIS